ncbi:hypothetical protein CTEN210_06718 [Chaetoceros tenuissimus]|uniref:HIT-type domain-containing protein n=1 Tax=Chaetoceros tenuissimus TaxID=426638 RepID=A0AAD3CQJ9_9STRA|nr:hypothetical protein CTEN210_06718 [Chaetoceros tenuissimus]
MPNFKSKRRPNKHNDKKSIGCGVCGIDDGKYKCPKCRVPYCSVKCCKEHKLQCMNAASPIKPSNSSQESTQKEIKASQYLDAKQLTNDPLENSIKRRQMLDDDDDSDLELEGWKITKEMMDRIDSSDWIRQELQDGGLRQIIAEIDVADDTQDNTCRKKRKLNAQPEPTPRELALMRARQSNPNFSNFIDRLLVTAGVLVEGDLSMEEQVMSVLNGNGNAEEQLGMLALAPIVKIKRHVPQESMFREIQKSESENDDDDSSDSGSSGSGSSEDDSSDDSPTSS